jgi:hypothetical protein
MAKAQEYVVGVLFSRENRTEVEFVTGVSSETKIATWEPGKKAQVFSKSYAQDLAFGLVFHGYGAIVMLKPDYLNLENPEKERYFETVTGKETNADKIRNMSDEELAESIPCPYIKNQYDECVHGWHDYDCNKCKLEWLRSKQNRRNI